MKLLITGGSGFVGLAIAEAAVKAGHDVILFASRPPPSTLLQAAGGDAIRIILGDIRSAHDVAGAMASKPTHVVHAAALTPALDQEWALAPDLFAVNVVGTVILAKAAADAGVQRTVVLSSNGVFGGVDLAEGPVPETRAPNPEGLYGVSKRDAEQVALRMAELAGSDVVVARLGSVYGPFEYESGVRAIMSPQLQMARAARAGVPARLSWAMRSDWVYSRDVAEGVLKALTADGLARQIFHISGGAKSDLLGWGRLLQRRYPHWTVALAAEGETPNVYYRGLQERAALDVSRFAEATGFRPAFDQSRAAEDFLLWLDRWGDRHG
jgi:nucleoside-diphosphate-sugar epimerase